MANEEKGRIDVRDGCYKGFQAYKLKHRDTADPRIT